MDISETNIPRYAIYRGRKVRVTFFEGANWFRIIDTDDSSRTVHRSQLLFLKEKKNG